MPRVHLLTGGGDLRQVGVVCGAWDATCATWQQNGVTCPSCLRRTRRHTPATGMSEKQVQELVRQACSLHGWLYYHTYDSRHSPSGFVDTVAVRDTRLVCAELKRRGQVPTDAQQAWLDALGQVRTVEVYTWTEDDLHKLLEVLR